MGDTYDNNGALLEQIDYNPNNRCGAVLASVQSKLHS